jgi:protease IV
MRWIVLLSLLLAAGCGTPSFLITPVSNKQTLKEVQVQAKPDGKGKVLLLDVDGMIANARAGGLLQASENPVSLFTQQLAAAAADKEVKAVVLRINSPGGTVTASELVFDAVLKFKADTGKPVIAAPQEVAASGGYMLALAADKIIARPTSLVGSVGVILQIYTFEDTLGKIGARVETFKSGEMKDIGSPFRTMKPADKAVMQKIVDEYYGRFIAKVRSRRPSFAAKEEPTAVDGRVLTGEQALALGMVDQLGSLEEAIDAARQACGYPQAKAVMYIRPYGYTGSIYAMQPPLEPKAAAPLTLALPESVTPLPEGFYYLWRP